MLRLKGSVFKIICIFLTLITGGCIHMQNAHDRAARQIAELAQSVDSLFAEPRELDQYEKTRLIISGGFIHKEEGRTLFSGHNQFKIALPGLKDRWGVLIGGSSDRSELELTDIDEVDQGDYESFLRFFPKEKRHLTWDFDLGIKYKSEVKYFGRVTGQYNNEWNEFPYRIIERIYWLNDDGFGEKSRFELDQKIGERSLTREFVELEWSETSTGIDISGGAFLRTQIRKGFGVGLEWTNYAHSHPWNYDYFDLVVRIRKSIGWEWLEAELSPRTRFYRKQGMSFDPSPSVEFIVSIRLDAEHLD
jgi:hypothetical protein